MTLSPIPVQTLELDLVDRDDEWMLASVVLPKSEPVVTGDQGVLACSKPPLPLATPGAAGRSCAGLVEAAGPGESESRHGGQAQGRQVSEATTARIQDLS